MARSMAGNVRDAALNVRSFGRLIEQKLFTSNFGKKTIFPAGRKTVLSVTRGEAQLQLDCPDCGMPYRFSVK